MENLPFFSLTHFHPEENYLHLMDEEFVRRYRIIPLKREGQTLKVGLSDPSDRSALDALTFHTGLNLEPVLVKETELTHYLEQYYPPLKNESLQVQVLQNILPDENKLPTIEKNKQGEDPLIQFVDHLLSHAEKQGASDLHIEPYEQVTRIRYRQDGLLYEIAEIENHLATRVGTRLKIMADLDITEHRLPQDGRFKINLGPQKIIDVRMSSCPTLQGEKIVLRLLPSEKKALAIDALGLTSQQKNIFLAKISQPQGLILVTGPTGSGKTLTLYSALAYLNTTEKNILTVEDPVEILLKGINQVHINTKIGLDFATTLRAFLRQDPDIIMVGEIRDKETAEIALQAAQTGHLVLSTLHTNGAIETLTRLISMGVAPYHIAPSLTLIVAQRLIRTLCPFCKKTEDRAFSCKQCRQGYQGRTGIFEMLALNETLISLMMKNADSACLQQSAAQEGFTTLWDAGMEKIQQGKTTFSELQRVLLK